LLWRDDVSLPAVVTALAGEGVPHRVVPAAEVAGAFPGLRPDGRDAVWQEDAGPVLAGESLAAQAELFARAGGTLRVGPVVRAVSPAASGVRVSFVDGGVVDADVAV